MEYASDLDVVAVDSEHLVSDEPCSNSGLDEPYIEDSAVAEEITRSGNDDSDSSVAQLLTEIKQEVARHPAMTTPFEDYTVVEGLLLLLFLSVFCSWLLRLVKGGFSWLSWQLSFLTLSALIPSRRPRLRS